MSDQDFFTSKDLEKEKKEKPKVSNQIQENDLSSLNILLISAHKEHIAHIQKILNEEEDTFSYGLSGVAKSQDDKKRSLTILFSGVQALKVCLQKSFDLIICDYQTTYMSGWEFIKQFKNNINIDNAPIILFGNERDVIAADLVDKKDLMKEYGIKSIIHYPFKGFTLSKEIEKNHRFFKDKTSVEYAYTQAKKEFKNKNIDVSKKIFSALNEGENESSRSNLGISSVYKAEGDKTKANQFLNKAIEKDSDNLSAVYEQFENAVRENNEKMIDSIPKLIFKGPDEKNLYALYKLSQILVEADKAQKSLDFMEKYKDICHAFPYFLKVLKARCYVKLEDTDKAYLILSSLPEKNVNNDVEVLNMLAIVFRKQEKFQESLDTFFKALEKNPTDHRILFNVALAYAHLKDYQNSIAYAEKVLKLQPSYKKVKNFIQSLKKHLQDRIDG